MKRLFFFAIVALAFSCQDEVATSNIGCVYGIFDPEENERRGEDETIRILGCMTPTEFDAFEIPSYDDGTPQFEELMWMPALDCEDCNRRAVRGRNK